MQESFERCILWKHSLAERQDDPNSEARARLRSVFLTMRAGATTLAGEISRSAPDFTVHDITHLDALWETADEIASPEVILTPAEAFVLGGAFMLHDLGMGLASYSDEEDYYDSSRWQDLLAFCLKNHLGRPPTSDEQANPPKAVQDAAERSFIRENHAKHAEKLATHGFRTRGGEDYHLIPDDELRIRLGPLIGKIAHSHWWDVDSLPRHFDQRPFSIPGLPREWVIDRLKIACLMRLADAAQIDIRRAPILLAAIRAPSGESTYHWGFQERLERPIRFGNRLVYTCIRPFEREYAQDWWLAFDVLRSVDNEFRKVNALLYDLNVSEFPVSGVAGVETPERFRLNVPTDDWVPIDASIRVSDIPHLVQQLGGRALYGNLPRVGLRELVQNSIDAVAVRHQMDSEGPRGRITVKLFDDGPSTFLQVADNGTGMSRDVLTNTLLDFGASLWRSSKLREEYPGLLSSGWDAIGRYGIGFYAVFLLGDRVIVKTKKYDQGADQTSILEFSEGVFVRPLLRDAAIDERLLHGGTVVTVQLHHNVHDREHGLFGSQSIGENLFTLCSSLFPAISVDLSVQELLDEQAVQVIEANDWQKLDAGALFDRLYSESEDYTELSTALQVARDHFIRAERPLFKDGQVVGRLAVSIMANPRLRWELEANQARICISGILATGATGYCGVVLGEPSKAARDSATVSATNEELRRWAEGQASMLEDVNCVEQKRLLGMAEALRALGAEAPNLPLGIHDRRMISPRNLRKWIETQSLLLLIEDGLLSLFEDDLGNLTLRHSRTGDEVILGTEVVVVDDYSYSYLLGDDSLENLRPQYDDFEPDQQYPPHESWRFAWWRISDSAMGDVVRIAAQVWGTSPTKLMQKAVFAFRNDLDPVTFKIGTFPNGSEVKMPAISLVRPENP